MQIELFKRIENMKLINESLSAPISHFLVLPTELRLIVYEYLFDTPNTQYHRIRPGAGRERKRSLDAHSTTTTKMVLVTFSLPVSILSTCH
jgi:hypothetical protein